MFVLRHIGENKQIANRATAPNAKDNSNAAGLEERYGQEDAKSLDYLNETTYRNICKQTFLCLSGTCGEVSWNTQTKQRKFLVKMLLLGCAGVGCGSMQMKRNDCGGAKVCCIGEAESKQKY